MIKQRIGMFLVCAVLAAASISLAQTKPAAKAPAAPMKGPGTMLGEEQWMDLPAATMVGTPSVPMGGTVKIAVVQGDPMTAGRSYTARLSCTDGTKIAPHWHPTTENVTVLKGALQLGMGSTWNDAAMKDIPVGGFVSAPAQMRHYAGCKGDSILQIHGIAPLVINFVAPGDDKPAK